MQGALEITKLQDRRQEGRERSMFVMSECIHGSLFAAHATDRRI